VKLPAVVVAVIACHAEPTPVALDHAPVIDLAMVATERLCVTHGAIVGDRISEPTVRAVAPGTTGTAALLAFRANGWTARERDLASGEARHQVGIKLRAEDSCNVLYVMWRSDKPKLEVSLKLNPGKRTHAQCSTSGYAKLRGTTLPIPELKGSHSLRGELVGNELTAWIDGRVAWRGTVPAAALAITGPSGFRTDNTELELQQFSASPGFTAVAACGHAVTDDD
jgi:hypothetical protein